MTNKTSANNIKILAINGSPRRAGNTSILIDELLAGAKSVEVEFEKVFLRDMNIKPCIACEGCKDTGRCVQKDDMQKLIGLIKQCDVCVFGTPVYFWGPTAQFKTFIDRFYSPDARQAIKGKRIINIIPFDDSDVETARHLTGMLTESMNYLKANIINTILAPDTYKAGDVNKHPEVLLKAREFGKTINNLY